MLLETWRQINPNKKGDICGGDILHVFELKERYLKLAINYLDSQDVDLEHLFRREDLDKAIIKIDELWDEIQGEIRQHSHVL